MGVTLSICIATLNRASYIGETIESIIRQATEEVEIVVLDGGSTDQTTQVVRQYQGQYPLLRYFRQDSPGGVDQDFCRAVELAEGDYCWLMSDDDILKPGAIRAVLNEIRNDYGLIIVNAEVRSTDLANILDKQILPFNTNRRYGPSDSELFFIDTARFLSFIGCVVIRRSLWNTRDKEKYFGTEFIHVGVIFQGRLTEDTIAIAEPYIAIRAGNAQWTSKWFEIWSFKWPKLIWSFPDYSDSAKSRVCPEEPWKKAPPLLMSRALGSFSLREYYKWIEPRSGSRVEKIRAKIIAQMPGLLVNTLGIVYFSICCRSLSSLFYLKKSRFYYRSYLKVFFKSMPATAGILS
jgi:abequosyltransferase